MDTRRLLEIWHGYLAAFNSHCLLALKEYYDPTCQIVLDGDILAPDRNSMMVNYADVWAKMGTQAVEALDVKPIEHGLKVVLRIRSDGKDITVDYLYNNKGLQIAHILNSNLDKPIE